MTKAEEDELVRRMAVEMQDLAARGPVKLSIEPGLAFALIGCLQLAWRHPRLNHNQKEMVKGFVAWLSKVFAGCAAIEQTIQLGWGEQLVQSAKVRLT